MGGVAALAAGSGNLDRASDIERFSMPTLPLTANPFDGAAVLVAYPIAAPPFTCSVEPGPVVPIPVCLELTRGALAISLAE